MGEVFGTIARATHDKFIRKLSDETTRKHAILALLEKKGRIEFGADGKQLTWPVRYKEHDLETYVDGAQVQFKRINPYLWATLQWRAYDMNTLVTKFERLTSKGQEALIKLYAQKAKELKTDFRRKLSGKFFGSGANGLDFNGVEAIYSATYAAGSLEGTLNGTYATISQVLGTYGGASIADKEYAFWSPTTINWNSTVWTGSAPASFATTALAATRYGILHTMRRNDMGERVDMVDLNLEMFRLFEEAYSAKEQIHVLRGKDTGPLGQMGFKTIEYDGVEVTWEENVAANVGYGLNLDYVKLCVLSDTLVDGSVEYDIDSKSWKMDADIFGNFQFSSPQHQFKLATH